MVTLVDRSGGLTDVIMIPVIDRMRMGWLPQ
jgi:hypothetical protein